MIDLKPFCGTDPFRPYLHQPFSVGEFSYAADGHIMVRVPRRPDLPEQEKTAKWDAPLAGIEEATFSPLLHGKLPDRAPKEDCDCYEGREHSCPDCECICEACGGSGEVEAKVSTTVRGSVYNIQFIRIALELPGVEFANRKSSDAAPLLFRFDGGIGAIMPMRSKYETHVEIEIDKAA